MNCTENGLVENNCGDESGENCHHIYSQLKLKEFLNRLVDVSAPFDSLDNRSKIIVHDENISSRLGNLSPSNSHGKSNISLLQSRCVISTIASHSNNIPSLLKTNNKSIFILWPSSGQDNQVSLDLIKLSLILNSIITNQLSLILWLGLLKLILDASALWQVPTVSTDDSSDSLHELRALHDDGSGLISTVDQSDVLSDGSGSDLIVPSDHSHLDACLKALSDATRNLLSDCVSDSEKSHKSEASFFEVIDASLVGGFEVALGLIDLLVADSDCSQSIRGHLLNGLLYLVMNGGCFGENLICLKVDDLVAQLKNELRGSFEKHIGLAVYLYHSAHSFSVRGEGGFKDFGSSLSVSQDIDAAFCQVFEQSQLGGVALLFRWVFGRVQDDGVKEDLLGLLLENVLINPQYLINGVVKNDMLLSVP